MKKFLKKLETTLDAIFCKKDYKNADRIRKDELEKFNSLGLDFNEAVQTLNPALEKVNLQPYSAQTDSIHWVMAAALSKQFKPSRILEIGTHTGRFTLLLRDFFPQAHITTVDLPENDPIFHDVYYGEKNKKTLRKLRNGREKFLHPLLENDKNVRFIEANSFFIPSLVDKDFDFIFVDAGHLYPEVAWDICNAYHLIKKPGGIMMLDDILPDAKMGTTGAVSDAAHQMIQFLSSRIENITIEYFLKRHNSDLFANPKTRKYVALIKFN